MPFVYNLQTVSTGDVGITLRVTRIKLPLTAQPEAHEDHPLTKVGRCVGSKEIYLMNLAHNIRARRGPAEGHTINLAITTASLELGHTKS
jgi:hypothetical protein